MNQQSEQNLTKRLQETQKEQHIILSLSVSLSKVLDKKSLIIVLNQNFKNELLFNDVVIIKSDEKKKNTRIFTTSFINKLQEKDEDQSIDIYFKQCINSAEPIIFDLKDFPDKKTKTPSYFVAAKNSGMRTCIGFCLPAIDETRNIIFLFYKDFNTFSDRSERIMRGISTQLSITIRNITISQQVANFTTSENTVDEIPEKEIKKGFSGIIGESKIMQEIYEQISQVAPSDSNVIIYGETGTGKELVAQAIHDLSPFSHKKMIRINCAAIPANLIESELFGHEKGSFTGATEQRKGKFEQAHNSTIFLDEIGELPLELQGRLLRVLQEKEIERIGGNQRIKVNARVITATNRILEKEVTDGNFRSDLFYRLNVFPIHLPALRDRKEDIPLLAEYFLEKHYLKTGKKINGFYPKVMNAMCENPWQGNIRELENMIERSILTAKDTIIKEMEFPKILASQNKDQEFQIKTLQEVEKEHILKVVEKCNGRISGKNGAALLLGLPSTTLISKMQKLGIKKGHYFKENE